MWTRKLAMAGLLLSLSGAAIAGPCDPPPPSPPMSWKDWIIELILDAMLTGPIHDYSPIECTDVEIFFE